MFWDGRSRSHLFTTRHTSGFSRYWTDFKESQLPFMSLNLTSVTAASAWGGRTWQSSGGLSWGSSRGWGARSGPALSGWPPGTRCRPCSRRDGPWRSHTSPPQEPSWTRENGRFWIFKTFFFTCFWNILLTSMVFRWRSLCAAEFWCSWQTRQNPLKSREESRRRN